MEKIKLRVWDKKNKEMIYLEDQAETHYNFEICAFDGNLYYYDRVKGLPGDDYVLMLYVGMDDKNGEGIYKGDIVKFKGNYCKLKYIGWQVGLVVWHEYSLGFRFFANNKYYHPINETDEPETKIKVIGNKYENPELLRGK